MQPLKVRRYYFSCGCKELVARSSHVRRISGVGLGPVAFCCFVWFFLNSVWGRASLQGSSPAPNLASRLGCTRSQRYSCTPSYLMVVMDYSTGRRPFQQVQQRGSTRHPRHPHSTARRLKLQSPPAAHPAPRPIRGKGGKKEKKKQREGGGGTNTINPSRYSLISMQWLWE